MASLVGRTTKPALLKANIQTFTRQVKRSTFKGKGRKAAYGLIGAVAAGGIGLGVALSADVFAAELMLHPPKQPWTHTGILDAFDMSSARRGYMVYKQVCAACHSIEFLCYRHLVGTIMTEAEAKAEAEEIQVVDGPDDEGNMFERPGKLSDPFPKPYANENEARAANNGAYPPDLSYITLARHGGEDYVFALLNGYHDPPEGVTLMDGQHYNPYFPGGAISMAQALYNEIIEYDDGTPATQSQLAKDVCVFLAWVADPSADDRKKMGMKFVILSTFVLALCYYMKRHKWMSLKTRKFALKTRS